MNRERRFLVTTMLWSAMLIMAGVGLAKTQVQMFYVASGSMEPTLALGTRLVVWHNAYANIAQVRRGDIIVHQMSNGAPGIKRVVALPGDKLTLKGTQVWLNGRLLLHARVKRTGKIAIMRETNNGATYDVQYGGNAMPMTQPPFSTIVPSGKVFCLGDNRDNANDSRFTGPVGFAQIIGKRVP